MAGREVRAGELLARETPYVSLLDREHTKSHCWHCLLCTKVSACIFDQLCLCSLSPHSPLLHQCTLNFTPLTRKPL